VFRCLVLLLLLAVPLAAGCGGSGEPKTGELTEEEKRQIEELNTQRVDEWGRKVK
jgi:hypothetical protein